MPDSPATLVLPPDSGYVEIPSIPTAFDEVETHLDNVMTKLSKLDVDGIARSLIAAANGVAGLTTSPEVAAAVVELREGFAAVRVAAGSFDDRLGPLATNANRRLDDAGVTLRRLDQAIDNVTRLTTPSAPLADGIVEAATEVREAARSVRRRRRATRDRAHLTGRVLRR